MPSSATIVWFRHDLRLADNPALYHAAERGVVIPVFIWAPEEEAPWAPGRAQRWWLRHSLKVLDQSLRERGLRLICRRGPSMQALRALLEATGADQVVWNRRYEPPLRERDSGVQQALRTDGIKTRLYESQLLHLPDGVETTSGGPYHVFTPFWKKVQGEGLLRTDAPLGEPRLSPASAPAEWPTSEPLRLLFEAPESRRLHEAWTPGEAAANERLQGFARFGLDDYEAARDRPDLDGTSRLSPHLHHGELSPRQVWHAIEKQAEREGSDALPFLRQLAWREFSYHMLYHYPKTPLETYLEKFRGFGWRRDEALLRRWQRGMTGYPIVDAGMRQLQHTGWMHNRVRMIVASFLTKDLLIRWQEGARWFWNALVDANLANNTMGWQWVAGCGADAQPFFRVFNPVTQGERHDPEGSYVRRWLPELSGVPVDVIHRPWQAPKEVLSRAGVVLGATYPEPIVDHAAARALAMTRYEKIR